MGGREGESRYAGSPSGKRRGAQEVYIREVGRLRSPGCSFMMLERGKQREAWQHYRRHVGGKTKAARDWCKKTEEMARHCKSIRFIGGSLGEISTMGGRKIDWNTFPGYESNFTVNVGHAVKRHENGLLQGGKKKFAWIQSGWHSGRCQSTRLEKWWAVHYDREMLYASQSSHRYICL